MILLIVFISLSACSKPKYPVDAPDVSLPFRQIGCENVIHEACTKIKIFRIPAAYILAAIKHRSNPYMESVILEFAYPGLQPWRAIPKHERASFQKIEVTLRSIVSLEPADRLREFYGKDKRVRLLETLDGLESYITADKAWNDYLPIDKNIHLRMHCAFSEKPNSDPMLGCTNNTFVPFKTPFYVTAIEQQYSGKANKADTTLWVEYRHKKLLLPHWSDIYVGLVEKIQSFEVTQ